MKIYFLTLGFSVLCTIAKAQEGSSCAEPILLDSLENECSVDGAYDLGAQGNSGVARPSCFPDNSGEKDFWFQFKPTYENINIVVRGASRFGNENTLQQPQMALYKGDCKDLELISCNSDARSANFIELTVGDLKLGETYLIRVASRNNHDGQFQLCINNFQFTPDYSSDCPDATVLCDKETIKVDLVTGTGKIQDEADNTCLDTDPLTGEDSGNSESSSVWFKWIARNDGKLTFTLDPINPVDDLDFAVFELPNGLNDCSKKKVLRCMASGENVGAPFDEWKICTGATGLREGETSTEEQRGCQEGNTNFLAPLEMQAGKAYALLINNFSESGSGFRLEFGGDGEFAGPEAQMIFLDDKPVYCPDEEIRFYAEDTSISGKITSYGWVYSDIDNTGKLSGAGPHSISFSTGGSKPILLNLESDIGCVTTLDTFIVVEDPIEIFATVEPVSCHGYNDARIDVDYNSPSPVPSAFWEDGSTNQLRTGLGPGTYTYRVTNERECTASATYTLEEPLPIFIDQVLTNASCGSGKDGAIELKVSGTFDPFQYNFNDGKGYTDDAVRTDLQAGVYPVSVRDGKGCEEDTMVLLSEIDLNLAPSIIQEPSCYGFADGQVELIVNGGIPPYLFDFDTTGSFINDNIYKGLSAGSYIIAIRDNDKCTGYEQLTIGQPDSLSWTVDTVHISCFGAQDGKISIDVTGGTPGYKYSWSNGDVSPVLINLQAGDFKVEITDQNNCTSEVSLSLREPPELSLDLEDKTDLRCFGDSDGVIRVLASGGEGAYMYTINNGSLSSIPTFDRLTAGKYKMTVKDGNQCIDSIVVQLFEPEKVVVHITAQSDSIQTIRLGESLDLGSSYTPGDRIMSWIWTPEERVDCADCPRIKSMPVVETLFTLTGTDQDGCMGKDELLVRVIPIHNVGVPNVVIPGQNGQNSYVTIYGGSHIARIIKFDVFDRWGNLLFTRSDFPPNQYQLGWDGTVQGRRLIPGVYVYSAQVEFIDLVSKDISGEILLIN